MKAFVVIDMQCGLLKCDPQPANIDVLIERINAVAHAFRSVGDLVIFVQQSSIRLHSNVRHFGLCGVLVFVEFAIIV